MISPRRNLYLKIAVISAFQFDCLGCCLESRRTASRLRAFEAPNREVWAMVFDFFASRHRRYVARDWREILSRGAEAFHSDTGVARLTARQAHAGGMMPLIILSTFDVKRRRRYRRISFEHQLAISLYKECCSRAHVSLFTA